jgi:hypothetical protein
MSKTTGDPQTVKIIPNERQSRRKLADAERDLRPMQARSADFS